MRRTNLGWMLGVTLLLAQSCGEPVEPPRPPPNFSHICCPAGISIPSGPNGEWTTLTVADAGGDHPFEFFVIMTHPFEQNLPAGGGTLGPFPGFTVVQLVAIGCNPDFVNLCFSAHLQRLDGSENLGHIRFGADLSSEPVEFNDFLFDVLLTPVPPQDTLALELVLDPDTVLPPLSARFDAVTQEATPAARTDTTRVLLRGRYLPSGLSAAGASVRIVMIPVAGSGGHGHPEPRPRPRFFELGQDVNVPGGGFTNQITVTLPASGDTTFLYRTSGVSGRELLVWRIRDAVQAKEGVDTVIIRWPALVAMPRTTATYRFKNQDPATDPQQRHGNVNHWIEPAFRDGVLNAFQRYFDAVPPPRFPLDGPEGVETSFVITDVSLEWGGLFDIAADGPWHNPHRAHRTGRDMDVRYTTMDDSRRDDFLQACGDVRILCEKHANPSIGT